MKRVMWLMMFAAIPGCDSALEPEAELVIPPSEAVVHLGTSYTLIDEQAKRLYEFNNCLTGLPPYAAYANCQAADLTYESASLMNWELASVFSWGTTTTQAAALTFLDNYIALNDNIYSYGRVSCRGRFAARGFAVKLRAIISALDGSQTVDLSSLPQPLTMPLWELNEFAGADYLGTPCGPTVPGPAFASLGGYSIFAITTGCGITPRALEINGNEFYAMKSVHSNGSMRVNGNDGAIWDILSYRCALSALGLNIVIGGGLPLLVVPTVATPITFDPATVPCTSTTTGNLNMNNAGAWWVGGTSASKRLVTGVWCATGTITLGVDGTAGNVMLKAGGIITINGDMVYLRSPHPSGVVLYTSSTSTGAMLLDGTYQSFAGYLYAPNGRVRSIGADFTVNGAIVATRVQLTGLRASVVTVDQQ